MATQTEAPETVTRADLKDMSQKELTKMILEQQEVIQNLSAAVEDIKSYAGRTRQTATREMTEEDAHRILDGDMKDLKHNQAANKLGLSYGQVYSCRLAFTFRGVHKQLAEKGWKNPWAKK